MSEKLHPPYADDAIVNVETQHEKSDVDVRALMWFVVIFVVFAVVTQAALWILFRFFVRLERGHATAPLTSMARPADANVPAEPRLQPFPNKTGAGALIPPNRSTPVIDMADMRAAEDRILNHYGWVDPQKGIVHIPIEEAKRRALQQLGGAVLSGAPVSSPARGAPPPGGQR
jgi:hypothetical protein